MEHRAEAQRQSGITDKQRAGLAFGRVKGTNHLDGLPKSEESKRKRSRSIAQWCKEHPAEVVARGAKTRGPKHYLWKGGVSRLNTSIRRMTENRKWMDAVKERDGVCMRCGAAEGLESHHIEPLSEIVERLGITSRKAARENAAELWSLENGITLCQRCHYKEHGRTYED